MGRGKLSMKLIENEKARASTLKKRMNGLKKKAYEFSILCDVKVCMVVLEPKLKESRGNIEVWPSDPGEVKTIIDKYKSKVASNVQTKIFSIFDFFNVRKRQVHDEVAQVRKANLKAKFPTWDDRINNLNSEQIVSFLTKLDLNLEVVKRKMMMMKPANPFVYFPSSSTFLPKIPNHSDESLVKLSLSLNPIENSINPIDKSLRMSIMNSLDCRLQSGMASSSSSSSSVPNNLVLNPVLHDPRTAMQNSIVMFKESRASDTCFYASSMQPDHQATYYQQQMMMMHNFPQMPPSQHTDFYHDINESEMENKRQRF